MVLIKTKKELTEHLSFTEKKKSIGLVPTMGALHSGHTVLVQRAVHENEVVVVSIFVNPTQFNNKEDLEKYPQTLKSDIDLLEKISKDILVFAPTVKEMYSNAVRSENFNFDGLENVMEGAFRKDHFDGVGTIVEILLTSVKPDKAYFGEKDFQQLQIIRKLVEIRNIPVKIIGCPIVRESNGLALSSRNERLSENIRNEAAFIFITLTSAKRIFGTESVQNVKDWVTKQFKKHPDLELEYIEITEAATLNPIIRIQKNRKYRAFIAVYADGVRLIDNIALN